MNRLLTYIRLMGFVQLMIFSTPHANAQDVRYTVTDLGTLGGSFSGATAINDSGQVVGNFMNADNQVRGFLWEDGTMIELGTRSGNFSYAFDINNLRSNCRTRTGWEWKIPCFSLGK
jgi:probable HAF family extracellular repeat protein